MPFFVITKQLVSKSLHVSPVFPGNHDKISTLVILLLLSTNFATNFGILYNDFLPNGKLCLISVTVVFLISTNLYSPNIG